MNKELYFATSFLHTPGQSTQYQINKRIMLCGISLGAFLVSFLTILLYRFTTEYGFAFLTPLVLIAISAVSAGSYMILLRKIQFYWQGKEGEKIARDEMEILIRDGYRIFNDVPCDGFNIDFLVIGPTGIYVVEVKNPKKRSKSDEVKYERGLVWAGGKTLKHNPMEQVKKEADWLERQLRDVGFKRLEAIKPVVLFPHFMVKEFLGDVWLLNPKRFASDHAPKATKVLSANEVESVGSIIQMHIKRKSEEPEE